MNNYLVAAIALAIALPVVALVLILPGWFLEGNTLIPVEMVTAFLAFDGIMVAATALFLPLNSNSPVKLVLIVSVEFVVSATAFLLSFRGVVERPPGFVHAGHAVMVGLGSMFGGVSSLLVLMIGAYLTNQSQNPTRSKDEITIGLRDLHSKLDALEGQVKLGYKRLEQKIQDDADEINAKLSNSDAKVEASKRSLLDKIDSTRSATLKVEVEIKKLTEPRNDE